MTEGDEAPLAAPLPTISPNLRSLKWLRLEDSPDFLDQVLGNWELDPSIPNIRPFQRNCEIGGMMFGKLRKVIVKTTHPHERAPDLSLMTLSAFLVLPALKLLQSERVLGLSNMPAV